MAVDYERFGELIDGYCGISADDLHALPSVEDKRDDEIALLRDENARLRQALAEVELILTGLRGGIAGSDSQQGCCFVAGRSTGLRGGICSDENDVLGGWQA